MGFFSFARFHAREGKEAAIEAAPREVLGSTRAEPGCLEIGCFRATMDPRLFWVHSRWTDKAAFENHAHSPTQCDSWNVANR